MGVKFRLPRSLFGSFGVAKEKLMTFGWFKQAYDLILLISERIKSSAIHQSIAARLRTGKAWLKTRLSPARLYINRLIEILRS